MILYIYNIYSDIYIYIYIYITRYITCLLDVAIVSFLKHLWSDDDCEIALPLQDREAAFKEQAAL